MSPSGPDAAGGDTRVRVGISGCLLGEPVRYDGGHKRNGFLVDVLARWVRFVPVCPEVEAGLGTPREALRLHRGGAEGAETRMISLSGRDCTDLMRAFARRRAAELVKQGLSGFVLKKGSPSCGLRAVPRYGPRGDPHGDGRGLFAAELVRLQPLLPVEEEGRLGEAEPRACFLDRIFAHHRLQRLVAEPCGLPALAAFHRREELLLRAYDPARLKHLERLAAGRGVPSPEEARERYARGFRDALAQAPRRERHHAALQHAAARLRRHLDPRCRREVRELLKDYRLARVPRELPRALLRHHARAHGAERFLAQTYLGQGPA